MKELTFTGKPIRFGSGRDVIILKHEIIIPKETDRHSKVYDYTQRRSYDLLEIVNLCITKFYQENYIKLRVIY